MHCESLPSHLSFDPNKCVLLVDDERNHRMLQSVMLRELGFSRFLFAQNGRQALEIYREHKTIISLVISDLRMPEMRGDELFWSLNQDQEKVPMLLCTGADASKTIDQMIQAGLKGLLVKPYSRPQLVNALVTALS